MMGPMTESDEDTPYVSIQADVRIDWRLLDQQESEQAAATFSQRSATVGLCSQIEYNKEELAPAIRKINKDHPEIASWLSFLQQTVETLATQLSEQRNMQCDTEIRRVSISASGIEFSVSQPCTTGDDIEMVLTLQPSVATIMVIGRITAASERSAEQGDDESHQLKIRFTHIRESDQELLIRHIHRAQIEELRSARAMRDSSS